MGKLKWVVAGLVALVVLASAGTWVYINVIREEAPDRLTLQPSTPRPSGAGATATAAAAPAGATAYRVADGSVVGYRVDEVLLGQNVTAVGRTSEVTGEVTLDGTEISKADFTVDMTTIKSDQSRRDGQFHGRIMDTATHPEATFALSEPIDLGEVPADGAVIEKKAKGKLTLRGTTKDVEVALESTRSGDTARIAGSIPIVFEDWGIPNPSIGPVTTEDNGVLEVALNLTLAS